MKSDPIPEIKQTKATEPIILDNNKPVYEQTVREIKTNSNEIIKKKAGLFFYLPLSLNLIKFIFSGN